ncbi:MAG: HAD family hydrolase [Desulfobacterales bacterium]|nr:MAG: HAD family hydrolase [Desulfobacterales bacterium]
MIRAILFDFGQTLVDSANGFRAAERQAQQRLYADFQDIPWENFLADYRRLRQEFHARSDFSRPALWQAVYHLFNREADWRRLGNWETTYWETVQAASSLFPETKAVLAKLAANYRIALITNTQGQKTAGNHRTSQFPELERFFEVIIVAGESGLPPKPDPAPFRLCLEKLRLAAAEAVFVGDDWRIDVGGAAGVGIQPVWLQHHSVRRNWPVVETTVPIITSLDQLLELDQILR